ncbi:MAG: dienelactone hydrolase family protein [Bacteroidota bacterium]
MINGFAASAFVNEGIQHTLYTRGNGPGIVLIHELPGLTKSCIGLANRLVDAGYRVYMPLLFGKPGKTAMKRNLMHVCISREFRVLATGKSSPVVDWLRAICHKAHEECGGPGVGAIGMCLTGNFTISLMADPVMLAPVSCQPSLPFPITPRHKAALAVAPRELTAAQARAEAGQQLMCFRFSGDAISPEERFEALANIFGPAFLGTQIDSSAGNQHDIHAKAHAVLTSDFVDKAGHPTRAALDRVLGFFETRLKAD